MSQNCIQRYLAGALFLLSGSLFAGSMTHSGLDELLQLADTVVLGKVVSSSGYWKGEKIFTRSIIAVEQTLKGTVRDQLEINTLGGTAMHPRLGFPVSLAASTGVSLTPGGTFVLLLRDRGQGRYQVVGMAQGKFPVTTDPQSGRRMIVVGPKKLDVKRSQPGLEKPLNLGAQQMQLDEFITFLQQHMKTEKERTAR